MTDRLDLPLRYRDQLEALLREHVPDVEVWAYGSRVNGRSHDGSDLDLVLRSPTLEPLRDGYLDLVEALEQSNIPILVQVHDWAMLPESFHREIERDYVAMQKVTKQTPVSGWQTTMWGKFATLEYGKSLRGYQTSEGPYMVYGTNGQIGRHTEPLCPYGSVIIGRKGAYRGVHYSPDPFFVIDTAYYLRPKVELDTRWAYYQLLTQDINGLDSGSAIPSTSRDDFYGLTVPLPPLPEQQAIAHILGTLDDKIELNRRMNQTLEEMARAIFHDWFVDFGPVRARLEGREPYLPPELWDLFPDRLVDSELGEIPEGWEVKALGEVVNHLRDSQTPTKLPSTMFSHFSIPAYDHGQVPKKELGEYIKSSKSTVQAGVVLLSKLNPEIERVWLVDLEAEENAICSTEFLVLQPRPPFERSFVYCLVRSPIFRSQIQSIVTGTSKSHQRAQANSILTLPTIVPSNPVIQAFNLQTGTALARGLTYRREAMSLAAQRDALLPKLVSGEVRVAVPAT